MRPDGRYGPPVADRAWMLLRCIPSGALRIKEWICNSSMPQHSARMLYHACQALIQISQVTGKNEESSWLQQRQQCSRNTSLLVGTTLTPIFNTVTSRPAILVGRDLHLKKPMVHSGANHLQRRRPRCCARIKAASIPKTVENHSAWGEQQRPDHGEFPFQPEPVHEGIARGYQSAVVHPYRRQWILPDYKKAASPNFRWRVQ